VNTQAEFGNESEMHALLHTLQWQFQLGWKLASQVHLPALTDAACLWEPAPNCWTVRQAPDGQWRPDWVVPEPDPPPPVTIGWLSWHLIWWWSGLQAAMRGQTPAAHDELAWPGNAADVVQTLEALAQDWEATLANLDAAELEKPFAFPWPEPQPLRLALAWANSELMKNIAEIGYVRHLFEAAQRRGS
jgi:hypothetical protein